MKMVSLPAPDGRDVSVNIDNIAYIKAAPRDKGSYVYFGDDVMVQVTMTPSELNEILASHESR